LSDPAGRLTALGRYEGAEPLLLSGHSVLRERFGASDSWTQVASTRIVGLYDAWGRPEQAQRFR
jgi:hypothetical protein